MKFLSGIGKRTVVSYKLIDLMCQLFSASHGAFSRILIRSNPLIGYNQPTRPDGTIDWLIDMPFHVNNNFFLLRLYFLRKSFIFKTAVYPFQMQLYLRGRIFHLSTIHLKNWCKFLTMRLDAWLHNFLFSDRSCLYYIPRFKYNNTIVSDESNWSKR